MPECHFHPGVETNVRCPDCERYICPKDMVDTPVGYKCRECGLMRRPTLGGVKPRQLLYGSLAGLGAAVVLAPLARMIPIFAFVKAMAYGALVAEATRRGSGGHRTWEFAVIAATAALVGAILASLFLGLDVFLIAGGAIVAALYITSARW